MLGKGIQMGQSKSYSILFCMSIEIWSILLLYIAHWAFTTQVYIKSTNISEKIISCNPEPR